MARRMSESEAWAWLAKKWDNPVEGVIVSIELDVYCEPAGLCPCIDWLFYEDMISEDTHYSMHAKIPKNPIGNVEPFGMCFRWPPTMAGAKKRAAFCRKMAAKTKVKR